MSAEKAAEVVRKLVANADSYEEALSVARAVDPRLLWRVEIKGFIKGSSLEALVKASLSLRHAAASLSNRELHYLQLAVEESKYAETALSKVNEEELGETARRLLNEAKAIIGVAQGDTSSLADLPLEVLIPVVQDLYINTEDVKERRALERLLELSLTGIAGLYQGKRTTYNAVGGRLDLRRSELKYIRMVNNFMTYRRREKAKNFSLLLDISGSMRPYSSMALAAAALATDSIDLLVLFNDTVKLVKGPLKRQTMIRLLASLRFDGYTNISQALRASETAKRAVIISDLRQTVRDLEPSEAICSFISKGRRLALLAPPSATLAEISKIQGCGASVVTVSGQSDVIRAFSKILRKV
ncbi:VWA domain-containing protein [Acidilobus sp.]|uniref:VWA domain-containing protein n=1 Tax=Acidilobus sp. TaxID=1872109 RepID=UPI003CFCEDAF